MFILALPRFSINFEYFGISLQLFLAKRNLIIDLGEQSTLNVALGPAKAEVADVADLVGLSLRVLGLQEVQVVVGFVLLYSLLQFGKGHQLNQINKIANDSAVNQLIITMQFG